MKRFCIAKTERKLSETGLCEQKKIDLGVRVKKSLRIPVISEATSDQKTRQVCLISLAMLCVNLGGGAPIARKIRWGAPGYRPVCPCIRPPLPVVKILWCAALEPV